MKFPFVIIAFVLFAVQLFAQPKDLGYEPPAGWTYSLNLDSTSYDPTLQTNGDTLVVESYVLKEEYFFRYYSVNSGKTWDTVLKRKRLPDQSIRLIGFYPNSSLVYRLVFTNKDTTAFEISHDLGRIFTEQYILGSSLYRPEVIFHPLDNRKIYILDQFSGRVRRSEDGGRIWRLIEMPHNGGKGFSNDHIEIIFDVRNPKVWNVLAAGADHYNKSTSYYRTSDDGLTFQKINVWGEWSGIKSEGVIRKGWNVVLPGKPPSYGIVYPRGVMDFINDKDTVFKDWAADLYENPIQNWQAGYGKGISWNKYIFYTLNPHHAFIVGGETYTDTLTNVVTKRRYDIWETKNDGEAWVSIWNPEPPVQNLWLDEKSNTLWALSYFKKNYDETMPIDNALWKRQISTSVEDNSQLPTDFKNVKIAPNPTENFTQISFKNSAGGKVGLALYDIFGTKLRTIYSGIQEAGEQKIIWNIPAEIPSGTYFLKLESGVQSVTEKIVITR